MTAGAWAEVRVGLSSPLVVLRRARSAGAPFREYVKLVALQLVLTILVMGAAAPSIVGEVRGLSKLAQKSSATVAKKTNKHAKKTSPPSPPSDEGSISEDDSEPDTSQAFVATHIPSLLPLWVALASLYGAWIFVELAIGALWKEHGEVLCDSLARAAGLPITTPPPPKPRIGLNLRWVVQKLWRQLLSALVFASGAPFFLLAKIAPGVGTTLYAIVVTVWGGYWLLVSTAAKADSAWRDPATRPPWFLRMWSWLTTHVPGFRWAIPRTYGRLWSRVTVKLHAAALIFEDRPYAFAGLAVMRVAGQLPLVSVVLRPLLPVAAELVALRLTDNEVPIEVAQTRQA